MRNAKCKLKSANWRRRGCRGERGRGFRVQSSRIGVGVGIGIGIAPFCLVLALVRVLVRGFSRICTESVLGTTHAIPRVRGFLAHLHRIRAWHHTCYPSSTRTSTVPSGLSTSTTLTRQHPTLNVQCPSSEAKAEGGWEVGRLGGWEVGTRRQGSGSTTPTGLCIIAQGCAERYPGYATSPQSQP
jgi:hypothetical protein